MHSNSTNSSGLLNIFTDSGEEFLTEPSYVEPIDFRFRIEGYLDNPMIAFVNEEAARLFAIGEPEI